MKKSLTWIFILIMGLGISSCSKNQENQKKKKKPILIKSYDKKLVGKYVGNTRFMIYNSRREIEISTFKKNHENYFVFKEKVQYSVDLIDDKYAVYGDRMGKEQTIKKRFYANTIAEIYDILRKYKNIKVVGLNENPIKEFELQLKEKDSILARMMRALLFLKAHYYNRIYPVKFKYRDCNTQKAFLEGFRGSFQNSARDVFVKNNDYDEDYSPPYSEKQHQQAIKYYYKLIHPIQIKKKGDYYTYIIPSSIIKAVEKNYIDAFLNHYCLKQMLHKYQKFSFKKPFNNKKKRIVAWESVKGFTKVLE